MVLLWVLQPAPLLLVQHRNCSSYGPVVGPPTGTAPAGSAEELRILYRASCNVASFSVGNVWSCLGHAQPLLQTCLALLRTCFVLCKDISHGF
jgi:hypothetical protein